MTKMIKGDRQRSRVVERNPTAPLSTMSGVSQEPVPVIGSRHGQREGAGEVAIARRSYMIPMADTEKKRLVKQVSQVAE